MSLALEELLCLPGLQDMRVRAGARNLLSLVEDGEAVAIAGLVILDDPLFRMNAAVAMLIWRMTEAQGKE